MKKSIQLHKSGGNATYAGIGKHGLYLTNSQRLGRGTRFVNSVGERGVEHKLKTPYGTLCHNSTTGRTTVKTSARKLARLFR